MSGTAPFERRLLTRDRGDGLLEKFWRIPWLFVLLLSAVAAVGYVALYSAGNGPEAYADKHALRFGFGLVLMLSIAVVDIRLIARLAWVGYALGVLLLVLVLLHGNVGKGAQRWIDIGPLQLQPSELMKIMLALGLAAWFQRASWERVGNLLFLIPPAIMVLVPVGLILKQPNLGTGLITAMIGGAVFFFAAGVRLWKFALILAAVGTAAPIAYEHLRDYQKARITTFLDPESDPLGAGYNIIQSKIALGSGGLFGKGFLLGTQSHLSFLPEKQTDFIFTMIAEEFGLVGALGTLGLLTLVVVFCYLVALRCRHQFGRLLAVGLGTNIFLYVFVNIAMVTGSIPVGGVPLPLISHGGSAMLTTMLGFGLLISVHVHRDAEFDPARE